MESLADIFKRHAVWGVDAGHADKGSTHSYIDVYERLLAPYRERCDFMEIGVASGYSMKMWGEYFGRHCEIWGVDLSFTFDAQGFDDRFRWFACDATKPGEFWPPEKCFDVIIDDASHMEADQRATFELLKGKMNRGGLYIIEDILAPEHALPMLTALHDRVEVFDLRAQKGRFDDMLIVYRF